jgi:hypothetical protein
MVGPGGETRTVGRVVTPENSEQAAWEKKNTNNRLINFGFIRIILINKCVLRNNRRQNTQNVPRQGKMLGRFNISITIQILQKTNNCTGLDIMLVPARKKLTSVSNPKNIQKARNIMANPTVEIKAQLNTLAQNLIDTLENGDHEKTMAAQQTFSATIDTIWKAIEKSDMNSRTKAIPRVIDGWSVNDLPGLIQDRANDEHIIQKLKLFQRSLGMFG